MPDQSIDLGNNPLLDTKGLPRFNEIKTEHVIPAVRHVLKEAEAKFQKLEENILPTWNDLLKPLEQMEVPFEYVWSPVHHLLGVNNSDDLRVAHETVLPEVVVLGMRMLQSRPVYDGVKKLLDSNEGKKLSEPQKRILELKIRDAEHAGVALDGEARNRFVQIEMELSQIATDFSNHVLDATKAFELIVTNREDTEGWPVTLLQLAAQSYSQYKGNASATPEEGPWRITLDAPSFVPFMQHSRHRDQREVVYRAFSRRASEGQLDNIGLIERTLKLRKEKAQLLGFSSYAELSLAEKMAPNVAAVENMSDELRTAAKPYAVKDLDELKVIAAEWGQKEPLKHWDLAFWAERLREERFDYTDEELRPYFPLPRVLEGLFGLSQRLFGISIEPADGEAPIWHPDVRYFIVCDRDHVQIASFYLDPYSRPEEKRGGAWMDDCLGRRWINGELRLPVVHLCCNGIPPVGDRPSLMSFSEVKTLFHEFGHGLQSMLTTVDFPDVAGLSGIEWDAVELASQFMENWCYHKPTLMGMSGHVETGERLPEDLFDKISAARTYRSGSLVMRQLEFGNTDMELHHRYDPDGNETAFDVHRRIEEEMAVFPPFEDGRFLCSFVHIFGGGYAAGYYSYKWAEVLSADAFAAFEEVGLDNEVAIANLGRRFRDTILAMGGSRPPMEVFKDFRGREPNTEALLRHSGLVD